MHSISPYLIRSYNKNLTTKKKYCVLNKIGQKDLLIMLRDFITPRTKTEGGESFINKFETTKQVYFFSDINFDATKRTIHGWFNVGHYGISSDILNIETGDLDYLKTTKNADMIKHYFKFNIPLDVDEGVCIFHNYNGRGVKSLFEKIFSPIFKAVTTLNIQLNPLPYEKAIQKWADANVKSLSVKRFEGAQDLVDYIEANKHIESEITLKPKRGKNFGLFSDFKNPDSEQHELIEILKPLGSQITTVLKLGDQSRTFTIGQDDSNPICQIDVDEVVISDQGIPDLTLMNNWVNVIINEYLEQLHPLPPEPS